MVNIAYIRLSVLRYLGGNAVKEKLLTAHFLTCNDVGNIGIFYNVFCLIFPTILLNILHTCESVFFLDWIRKVTVLK